MDLILFVTCPWHGINNVPDPFSFSRFQGKDAPFNCSSTPVCKTLERTYLLFTEHLQQAVIKDAQVEMLQAPRKNGQGSAENLPAPNIPFNK